MFCFGYQEAQSQICSSNITDSLLFCTIFSESRAVPGTLKALDKYLLSERITYHMPNSVLGDGNQSLFHGDVTFAESQGATLG